MEPLTRPMNIISRCANLYRDAHLAQTGLTGCQVPYILQICRLPGQTQEELAQRLHVHKSSVTRKLAALEGAGWVRRAPCPEDRRAQRVYPTPKAQAALPKLHATLQAWNDYLTQTLTAEEGAVLLALLQRVAARAEAWAAERGGD